SFGSWTLTLGVSTASSSTTTTIASALNPSFTTTPNNSASFTAIVTSGAGTPTGTVTFKDGATTLCNNVALDGSAHATCGSQVFSAEGNHTITAFYNGGGSFAASNSNALNQFVEIHSSNPQANQFCDTGSITIPGIAANQTIYPSVVTVSGIAGS